MPLIKKPLPYKNEGGRPVKYDREVLAQDIMDWVQDEDHWSIKPWRIKHRLTYEIVQDMREDSDTFRQAYAYAMDVIADRRERMNHADELKDSLYNQHLHTYDRDRIGVEDNREDKKMKREIKIKETSDAKDLLNRDPIINQKYEDLMNQISALRSK